MSGLAEIGGGNGWDINCKIGNAVTTTTFANTSTAQYKVVYAQCSTTTEDFSADYMVTTTMYPVGIVQNVLTNGSDYARVRVAGITKAIANDSILAFAYVRDAAVTAGGATSTAGYITYIAPTGDLTGSVASKRILGIALQQAQKTGAAISILLLPQIAY